MSSTIHTARYILESARCAVVTSDDRSFQLGYFIQPRHEWVHVATFADEARAKRAFAVFDRSVAEFSRAWGPKHDPSRAVPAHRTAA